MHKSGRYISVITGFLLVIQSLAPSILAINTVYAQDASASSVTVTPTETATPTPTDTPTSTPTVTVAPTATPSDTSTPTPTEITSPTPSDTVTPTATPEATVTITPTDTVTPTATPTDPPHETSPPAEASAKESPPTQGQILDGVSTTVTPTQTSTPTPTPTITVAPSTQGNLSANILKNTNANLLNLDAGNTTNATLTTNKADYAPTDTAVITGTGFLANHTYSLTVSSTDAPATSTTVDVKTDATGSFVYAYQLDGIYRPNYTVTISNEGGHVLSTTTFTDSAANLDQCQNGGIGNTPERCANAVGNWVNGNVNGTKAHWDEGDFVSYRTTVSGINSGAHTLDISYKIVDSNEHAFDYLGSFDATETTGAATSLHANQNDPCSDKIPGCNPAAPTSTQSIPAATLINCGGSSGTIPTIQVPGSIKVWGPTGSTISSISYLSQNVVQGGNNCFSNVRISFNVGGSASNNTLVFAWGGHIAKGPGGNDAWGVGNSATAINGSPYHMSLIALDGASVGSQDRALSAGAIIPPSTITIHKVTSPTGGTGFGFSTTGGITPATFTLNDGGSTSYTSVVPGSYTVVENDPTPYALSNLVCTANGTGTSATPTVGTRTVSITIGAAGGGNVDCTYTNTLQNAHLTLVKTVTNDNGGNTAATAWTLTATGPTTISGTTGSTNITNASVNSGTYTLSESGPTGYTAGNWSCTDGTQNGNQITLSGGQSATCTINNDDVAPTLKLVKVVSNTHGGTGVSRDWTLTATGTSGFSDTGDSTTFHTVNANTAYTLSESGPNGYTASAWTCSGGSLNGSQITLNVGQNVTCSITNSDQAATLIVKKIVHNNYGGTKTASDFTFSINGGAGTAFNSNGENDLTVNAGTYNVTEPSTTGYTASYDNCSNVTIANGQTATCTITNSDVQPKLTVTKIVQNNHGGTKQVSDFSLFVSQTQVTSGVQNGFNAGSYTVSETNLPGYTGVISGDCASNGNITLAIGDVKSCTITNSDTQPQLKVVKIVNNRYGGTSVVTDFTLNVGNTIVTSGQTNSFDAGTYTVTESGPSGYSGVFSGDCDVNGNVTLTVGDALKTCTITNSDIAPQLTVIKHVINDNGGTKSAKDFTMSVTGTNVSSSSFAGDEKGTTVTLNAGSYSADEASASGYTKSLSADCTGTIAIGETKTCTITNDDIAPLLTVTKVVVNNAGSNAQVSDFPLFVGLTQVTSGSQTGFDAGSYIVSETNQPGFTSAISGDCDTNGNVTLAAGDVKSCTITNTRDTGTIIVHKDVDTTGTNQYIADDAKANTLGFSWTLDNDATNRDMGTNATVTTIDTHTINEATVAGFLFTGWFSGEGSCNEPRGTTLPISLSVTNGQSTSVTLCNKFIAPHLQISKVNNATGDKAPGDNVLYTITVKALDNTAYNVHVTDLLPDGFKYRSGSWTATLNGAPLSIGEPTYHSPGVWSLGTMQAGDTAVLTLIADIDGGQKPGLYKDIAWAYGCDSNGSCAVSDTTSVLSDAVDPGKLGDNFVGTQVNVNANAQNSGSINVVTQGSVLGASTELPSTGANSLFVIIASALFISGLVITAIGIIRRTYA